MMNTQPLSPLFVTTDELAQQKKVHRETVLRAIRRRELPAISLGEGRRKIWLISQPNARHWTPKKPGRPRKGIQP